jgi:hypothetical protein
MSRMDAVRKAAKSVGSATAGGAAVGGAVGYAASDKGDKFSGTMRGALSGAIGSGTMRLAGKTLQGMSGMVGSMPGMRYLPGKSFAAGLKTRASVSRGMNRMGQAVGGFTGMATGTAAAGFASNMIQSNAPVGMTLEQKLNAKYDYRKRVKKMEVDENLRQYQMLRDQKRKAAMAMSSN